MGADTIRRFSDNIDVFTLPRLPDGIPGARSDRGSEVTQGSDMLRTITDHTHASATATSDRLTALASMCSAVDSRPHGTPVAARGV
jgi:hypothetical protein